MTTAPTPSTLPHRFAVAPLALATVACGLVAGVAAYGLAGVAGWGVEAKPLILAAASGAGACLLPALLAIAMLALLHATNSTKATIILAASVARMLFSLLLALTTFFLLNPEGKTFWTSFLIAGLLTIAAEAAWGVRELARTDHASNSPHAESAAGATIGVS
jgi:hypothetical protein